MGMFCICMHTPMSSRGWDSSLSVGSGVAAAKGGNKKGATASSGGKNVKVKKAQNAAKNLKTSNSFKMARVRTNVHFFR